MTDQSAPEGTPMSSAEPPPLAPLVEAAAAPPPMPAAAPMQPMAPPPAVAWQAPPAAVPARGGRTPLALAAGILLLLGGIGGILLGLLIAVVGGSIVSSLNLSQFGDVSGLNGADPNAVLTGAVAFIGIVILIYSLVYLLAGIGVVRSRGWGRVMGIIVGVLSGLFWLSGLSGGGSSGGLLVIVLLGIHAYIAVVLLFFWRSKATA
jgi:hypothetical protein